MLKLTIRRGSWPAIIGCALVAASVVAASCVAVLSRAPGQPTGTAVTARGAASRHSTASTASAASAASAATSGASAASLTGSGDAATALNLPVPAGVTSRRPGAGTASPGTAGTAGAAAKQQPSAAGAAVPRLIVPDIIAAVPGGVTAADLDRISKLRQVRAVLPIAGARITVNGRQLTVLGASAAALRPWTPPATAVSQQVWSDFARGDLITTAQAALADKLVSSGEYPVAAAVRTVITFGARALLGIAGVDAIVDEQRARQLGLVPDVAVLINAPAADMNALVAQVKATLGRDSRVIRLVPVELTTRLPVDTSPPKGRPTSYLALFQESAAQYCPGLSWTVLAAIGQIESDDGANMGPSTAGALGPMQFLPSTWRLWGIDGFGETGPPDIMNPLDAVPSAARMLCADGAAAGGQALWQAIFDYNHADWYVDEVLTLAAEYAREFG